MDSGELIVNHGNVTNAKAPVPALPHTGGMAADRFAIMGGGLMLVAGAAAATLQMRRRFARH